MKRTWTTPQLVALVRGAPEEAVLVACKAANVQTAPNATASGCMSLANLAHVDVPCGPTVPNGTIGPGTLCVPCSTVASS
jgi:hypothetical protein